MVNVKDLWIGDTLMIISSSRVGSFEGLNSKGKIRIKSNGKVYLATPKNLKIYDPKKEEPVLEFIDEAEVKVSFTDFPKSIDLHIETLKPDLLTAMPERIIDYQLKAFEKYFEMALKMGVKEITIIHGKGKGILKNSILGHIKNDKRVMLYTEIHQGGALQLLLI